jgi:hypothetical protein
MKMSKQKLFLIYTPLDKYYPFINLKSNLFLVDSGIKNEEKR